jgi:hypothetical protein
MCCLCCAQVVGKGMGPEPDRAPARAAGGEAAQGVKRSRFALEAEEQQVSMGSLLVLKQHTLFDWGPQCYSCRVMHVLWTACVFELLCICSLCSLKTAVLSFCVC